MQGVFPQTPFREKGTDPLDFLFFDNLPFISEQFYELQTRLRAVVTVVRAKRIASTCKAPFIFLFWL